MKILKRVAEEETGLAPATDGEPQQLQNGRQRSSESENGNEDQSSKHELGGANNNVDDETLSPEEEAAAQAAVRRNFGRAGVPRRSVQYDNPELMRLVATTANNGATVPRKGSTTARGGGSFSEER